MKYTQIPQNTFKELQLNAGILVDDFNPLTGVVGSIIGATSGGVNFTATPSYTDFGDDIDNCPKNTMELKKLESWEVKMSGTFVSVTKELAKKLVAVGDVDAEDDAHIIPRNDIALTDFGTVWWIGDYSDVNTGADAGFIAIKLFNALSTGGFQIQTSDKAKGQFAFEFTGHYSINAQDTVPFEIYVKAGQSEPITPTGVGVAPSTATLANNATAELTAGIVPTGATAEVTWTVDDDTNAVFVVDGAEASTATGKSVTVKGKGGNAVVTATISDGTTTYTDTCTITAPSTTE